jgi:hypothetical protein
MLCFVFKFEQGLLRALFVVFEYFQYIDQTALPSILHSVLLPRYATLSFTLPHGPQ